MITELNHLLDTIVELNLGEPVGNGYIDIIVMRSRIKSFINDLTKAGFRICGVSWWEYCKNIEEMPIYGMGGPKSVFFNGWFAEMPITEIDSIGEDIQNIEENNFRYESLILSKEFRISEKNKIYYKSNTFLVPGFYIDVPSGWKNTFQESVFVRSFKRNFELVRRIINKWDPIGLIELGAPPTEYDIEIYDFLPKILYSGLSEKNISEIVRNSLLQYFESEYKSDQKLELEISMLIKNDLLRES